MRQGYHSPVQRAKKWIKKRVFKVVSHGVQMSEAWGCAAWRQPKDASWGSYSHPCHRSPYPAASSENGVFVAEHYVTWHPACRLQLHKENLRRWRRRMKRRCRPWTKEKPVTTIPSLRRRIWPKLLRYVTTWLPRETRRQFPNQQLNWLQCLRRVPTQSRSSWSSAPLASGGTPWRCRSSWAGGSPLTNRDDQIHNPRGYCSKKGTRRARV